MSQPGKAFFLDTLITPHTPEEIIIRSNIIDIDTEEKLLVETLRMKLQRRLKP